MAKAHKIIYFQVGTFPTSYNINQTQRKSNKHIFRKILIIKNNDV